MTTDSLHHFLPNVRFTEPRSGEGKSTVRRQVGQVNRIKRCMGPIHHFLSNVRFTELRSSEGKSTVRKQIGQVKDNKN